MVLFSTASQLRRLARASTFCMDGTFKITPKPWAQVAIISAEISTDVWVPIAFGLLPDKKYETYVHLFMALKTAVQKLNLEMAAQHFMADFEVNIRKAAKSTFTGELIYYYILYPILYAQKFVKSIFKRDFAMRCDVENNNFFHVFMMTAL